MKECRYIGMLLLCAVVLISASSMISAQTTSPPLKAVELHFGASFEKAEKQLRESFQGQATDSALETQLRDMLLELLKSDGYYFPVIDSLQMEHEVGERQTSRAIAHIYGQTGRQLFLDSLTFSGLDSVPEILHEDILETATPYRNAVYTSALINGLFRDLLIVFENNGFPLAKLNTGAFDIRETEKGWGLNLEVDVAPGDSISIAYLSFPKQQNNIGPYLQRTMRFQPGEQFDEQRISRYSQILSRQEFLKKVDKPVLARDADGQYFLSINFEEAPSTTLDGIVGYIPPASNQVGAEGYFTGQLNIGVRNLFGGGRKLQIFWQKPDSTSDEFRLAYREPFIFKLPIHTEVTMNRVVRGVTFIEWEYGLNFDFPLRDDLTAFLNFKNRSVFPDSLASRQLRLPITNSLATESGLHWDRRDNIKNPRKGLELRTAFEIGSQNNTGPDYLLVEDSLRKRVTVRRVSGHLGIFLPTFERQLISNELRLEFLESTGEALRLSDQFFFGGATTVRGFRESQFSAKRAFWVNSEYRFILGPQSRLFLFTDNAYYTRNVPDFKEEWLNSYGMGVRFPVPLGIVQVDFGLERGTPFREGKLHFRLLNEF